MKVNPETGLNHLKEMDPIELLKYCALDSWYELKLYQKQMHHFKYKKAFKFFMEGLLPLIRMQNNGVNIDREYFEKTIKSLDKELASIDCDIMTSKEAIAWKESEDKPLNYQSSPQLKKLFYKILDYKVIKTTGKGNPSVDAEVLEKIKNKFTKNILKQRKTKKNLNFIKFYNTNVQPDGYLHPSYNLHIPKTYRSSSEFQNVPKHDEVAKKLIRRGIIPRPGNFLLEPDYGQLEVRISCCYTHDPALIKYCSDPSTDMHLDQARKTFIMPEMLKKDPLRYVTKNGFVFPEFYGSWWGKIAGDLWEIIDRETKQHLKKHGIPGLGRILRDQSGRIIGCTGFYEHLKNIESDMWNRRFKVYTQWKKDIWNFYLKYGYVRSFTGFTYSGPMVRTEVTNYPIQGAAFHCLLYSIINIEKEMMKRNLQSKMIIEIHDAIVFDVVPKEYEILRKIIKYVMTEKIREDWKWINIPLVVEADKSAIDGNWSEMSEIKDF
jgi:DNA polymerase-1